MNDTSCKLCKIFVSGDKKLKCFECNSHLDPRCRDPFNWTTVPPTKLCDGCCVKIVQGLDTRKFFYNTKL